MTADDVVYSLTRVLDPATHSTGASYLAMIRGADAFRAGRTPRVAGLRALDRYTVQVEVTDPGTPFVLNLAVGYASIVPRDLVQRQGERFGVHPVGTGPFKFGEWVPNQRVLLTANPEYFEGRPYLDGIHYHILPGDDAEAAFAAFQRGELHDTPIPAAERAQTLTAAEYTVVRGPYLGISFLGLRTTAKPLDDSRVRQALNYAIDRPRLIREVYRDRYASGSGILPPGTYGYNPHYVGYPYDPQKAAQLLAEAGYPKGQGFPVLPLWSARKNAETEAELAAVVQDFAAIGVRAEVHYNSDWPTYKANVYAGTYPVFRFSWYATAPSPEAFLGQLLESTSPDNLTQLHDPAVDALLRRARAARGWPQKLPLYQEIERRVVSQAPLILLYYATYERLFQRAVHGVEVSAMGDPYMPMKKIWLEAGTAEPRAARP
jgi:peptide/nickel transport system substrate-binding protein/oligopeptide transport system substrate-binding protein